MRIIALVAGATATGWWLWVLGLSALAGIVALAYEVRSDRPQPTPRDARARTAPRRRKPRRAGSSR